MSKKVFNRILLAFACVLAMNCYADDSGGGFSGGLGSDIGGLGDSSGLGGGFGNNNSNNSSANDAATVMVPSILGAGGANSGNNAQLNLNNQEMYHSTNGQMLSNDDIDRTNTVGVNAASNGDLWQNYANINRVRNGGFKTPQNVSNSMSYVPSVLGNGYVINPLMQQDPFQKNVQIRSGLFLPMYGYNLFQVPATFAPVNNIPVDANYTLGPGDQVNLKAWGSMNVNTTTPVAKDGTIFFPKVGKISVAGIKAASLDDYLKSKIGKIYRNYTMSATVSQIRSIAVNVAGYAVRPGTYQLSALASLSNAAFAVGGPSLAGSLRHVKVKRDGRIVEDFDMYDIILRGDNAHDVRLLPGDTIYFAPKGNQVAIYEGVKVPAIYEALASESVKDITYFAGGFNYNTAQKKVIVETVHDHEAIVVKDYSLKDGLNKLVSNGDVIHFFSLANNYESSIVLMGNVAEPSRFAYKNGMRIKDVVKDKAMLLTRSYWNSYAYNTAGRDNLLTQIAREKTTAQVNADNTSIYSTGSNANSGSVDADVRSKIFGASDNLFIAGPIQIPEANINWNYATIIRMNKDTFSTNVIPFNLRKALAGDESNNLALQPGDVIDILSAKDVRTPSSTSTVYVFVDGEVNSPGVYEMRPKENITDVIKKANGLSDNAYLYGTELTRESVKKKQQVILNQMLDQLQQTLLGQVSNSSAGATSTSQVMVQNQVLSQQQAFITKMRQIKPSGRVILGVGSSDISLDNMPAIQVENGDTLYIPTRPSTIDVIGQVYNPATLMYKPDLTVSKYIDMAGTENQFADTSNEYVLRADGTIYSRQQAGWYGGFASRKLNPGDAIIVPQQIQFGAGVQNIMNWTQIIANSAQAIALFNRN